MDWFKAEFAKSNIISGLLAVAIWGAIIFLAVTTRPIPEILYVGGTTVVAFFFGSRVGQREGMDRAAQLVERVIGGDRDG